MFTTNLHMIFIFVLTFVCVSGQCPENIRMATSGCNKDDGDCSPTCEDVTPPGMTLTCEQISNNNLCDLSNITSGNFCQKSCGTCGVTSVASSTSQTSSTTCPKYHSKISIQYNRYDACVTAARTYDLQLRSVPAVSACEIARDVEDLFRDCQDMANFTAKFITLSKGQFSKYSNPNTWGLRSLGLALEPYTFQERPFYALLQHNGNISDTDELEELDYNFYTDCRSSFGDQCTWYNQGKLRTFYQEEGGAWLLKVRYLLKDFDTRDTFYTPIIIDGHFYGLVYAALVYKS